MLMSMEIKLVICFFAFYSQAKKGKKNKYLSTEKLELYKLLHFLKIYSKFCDLFIYVFIIECLLIISNRKQVQAPVSKYIAYKFLKVDKQAIIADSDKCYK